MKLRNGRFLGALLLMAAWVGSAQAAEEFQLNIVAGHSDIVFDERTGTPVRWELCQSLCSSDDRRRAVLFDVDDGGFHVGAMWGPGGVLESSVTETDTHVIVRFAAPNAVYEYSISRLEASLELLLPDDALVEISAGKAFIPDPMPGFGQIYSHVDFVTVNGDGQVTYPFEDELGATTDLNIAAGDWMGVRNRYWTLLTQPVGGSVAVTAQYLGEDRPSFGFKADSNPLALKFYAGPVDWQKLRAVSPDLSEMLFAALWEFLRWLCFGILLLLEFLYSLVGNYGVAIVLLSLSAKIILTPVTMLADRWQGDVNRVQSLLKPELDAIRRSFKGEEAHKKTLAVYKKYDVSTFYTFKSAAGFLIQIPMFIAAFDVLSQNASLNQISFLWIADLAKPDSLVELPFVLPFFGGWLNLLPFLMTFLSVLAAWLQSESTLSPELQRQQSLRLYLMAAAFFVLFYTFPASMVLYWTSSNLFHLIKVESGRLLKRG